MMETNHNTMVTKQLSITLGLNLSTTLLLLLLQHFGFTEVNIVVLYILSVLITSRYTKGYAYGIVASIISMLSFNFFFTEPRYTLKVEDSTYIFTFMVMLLSAIFTSTLASKLIHSKDLAKKREKQSRILYQITSSLAKTSEVPEVASASVEFLSNFFGGEVLCFIVNTKDDSAQKFEMKRDNKEAIVAILPVNTMEKTLEDCYSIPIKVHNAIKSYVCIPKELENMDEENRFLLDSIIMQITIAMERVFLIRDKEAAKSETHRERFKSNLLRAISHDLRTPLTRITGSAEMLLHNLEEEEMKELVSGIYEDSSWLTRLVENILNLTRIQEGRISMNIQLEAVEEIIGESVERAFKYSPNHKIKITVPDEVLFVPMDGKLIEQVLINLIHNAIQHTKPSDQINVSVWKEDQKAWFEVADSGVGLNEEDLPKIFDMFFVSKSFRTDGKQGMGLGLSICKSIIHFHGGEIYGENNDMGGATFRFYLNM